MSHKPSWIKRIILGFPLKSFPWFSWSQQQIRLQAVGTLDKNVIFIFMLRQTVWLWDSKTSPQTLHLLPPLLASSTSFLAFFLCPSISSSCFLSPPTADNLLGLLPVHFVQEPMNFATSLQRAGASSLLNFSHWSCSRLVEFILRLRSSPFSCPHKSLS